jgi:hypothetical protein
MLQAMDTVKLLAITSLLVASDVCLSLPKKYEATG